MLIYLSLLAFQNFLLFSRINRMKIKLIYFLGSLEWYQRKVIAMFLVSMNAYESMLAPSSSSNLATPFYWLN